jgi:hypothetical protein
MVRGRNGERQIGDSENIFRHTIFFLVFLFFKRQFAILAGKNMHFVILFLWAYLCSFPSFFQFFSNFIGFSEMEYEPSFLRP